LVIGDACLFVCPLFGENNAALLAAPDGFRVLLIGERKWFPKKVPNRELCDCAVNPCCAGFVAAQRVHPVLDFFGDPKRNAILRLTSAVLVRGLSF
jgi:hypothetical protein